MKTPAWLAAARDHWHWRGDARPPFAETPGPGRRSVWDFPRPPALEADTREVVVSHGAREIARTRDCVCVLETSHPPSFYLPWSAVARAFLQPGRGESFCEWKGPARFWDFVDGDTRIANVAWSYPHPLEGAEVLAERVAFYPSLVECFVDGARVRPQPGTFYGGWITPDLAGPFKGEAGSAGW